MDNRDFLHLAEADEVRQQRRQSRERIEAMLVKLVRVASDIRRILQAVAPDKAGLHESLRVVRDQLIELLRAENAELFGEVGDMVTHRLHRVLESRPSDSSESRVLEVEKEGLIWKGEVIEKAEVIVLQRKNSNCTREQE